MISVQLETNVSNDDMSSFKRKSSYCSHSESLDQAIGFDDGGRFENDCEGLVPKMSDVIKDAVHPKSPYSKLHFVQFLLKSHCIENLDFYMDLTQFLTHYECHVSRGDGKSKDWSSMFRSYIESEIVNLPGTLIEQTDGSFIPPKEVLMKIQKLLRGYLHNSYHVFVEQVSAPRRRHYSSVDENPFEKSVTPKSSNTSVSPATSIGPKDSDPDVLDPKESSLHPTKERKYSVSNAALSLLNVGSNSGNGSWGKLTRKFKWRRASSSSKSD
ncbi:hypothetical protein HII12_002805 [Brettanomyces bruxellensis]|uniref:RGS domain-containing protein n=1 Tax=Dekkera bruxellensis TaxID=5007 RepID=A0A8H6BFW8_DEKBR|nr:hypothetical protein HII12_002805 [Brettanomyces bruxellensis]